MRLCWSNPKRNLWKSLERNSLIYVEISGRSPVEILLGEICGKNPKSITEGVPGGFFREIPGVMECTSIVTGLKIRLWSSWGIPTEILGEISGKILWGIPGKISTIDLEQFLRKKILMEFRNESLDKSLVTLLKKSLRYFRIKCCRFTWRNS